MTRLTTIRLRGRLNASDMTAPTWTCCLCKRPFTPKGRESVTACRQCRVSFLSSMELSSPDKQAWHTEVQRLRTQIAALYAELETAEASYEPWRVKPVPELGA